jgi:uncharacterized phiE125 gp8 family phage protein
VAQAKEHLRVVGSDDDAYIAALIVAARQTAEGRLNRALMPQTLQAGFVTWGEVVRLPRPPFISVEAVEYLDAEGVVQTLDPDAYIVADFVEPVGLMASYGNPWPALREQPGAVLVTYRAGYLDGVPQPIVQWMLLEIGAMYGSRESFVTGTIVSALPEQFTTWLLQPYMVYE